MGEPSSAPIIVNFGGNVQFQARHFYAPRDEAEVLSILDRHAQGKVRVVGSKHAWSEGIVSADATIDLQYFQQVTVTQEEGEYWATVGGGCPIHRILGELSRQAKVTVPALGLITEQTIAGAISTATHGSGRSSLSHYVTEIRAAAFDPETGAARIFTWTDGPELRAARCALGCMGVILSVKFRCVPQYWIEETTRRCATLEEVLAGEAEFPLQQFYFVPYSCAYYVQQRRALPAEEARRSWYASLYRWYWFGFIDVGLHLTIKLLAALRRPRLVQVFYRWVLPALLWKSKGLVERSDRALVMEHELFRHLEIELFVPAKQVRQAAHFVRQVLSISAGDAALDPEVSRVLAARGLLERLMMLRGRFTYHYLVTFRRVLPDDTLISMTADADDAYYALSFITYVEPRDSFFELARFLSDSMIPLFGARLHWGKYFPAQGADLQDAYPHLPEFRALCRRIDPRGVFRNTFTDRVLGFDDEENPVRA